MPVPKRSVRVGINLTPEQNQQLQLAAQNAQRLPSVHAYELVRSALENPQLFSEACPLTGAAPSDSLADLYGLLDSFYQTLTQQRDEVALTAQASDLISLLNEVNGCLVELQQTLRSIPGASGPRLP